MDASQDYAGTKAEIGQNRQPGVVARVTIHDQAQRTTQTLDQLKDRTELLRERLSPVLRPSTPSIAQEKGTTPDDGSDMAAHYYTLTRRGEAALTIVEDLLERLDF